MASLCHILSLNTRLEDLVVRDISCERNELEGMREVLAKMPPLEFSSLQRICIVDSDKSNQPVLATVLNSKITTIFHSWYRHLDFSNVTVRAFRADVVSQQHIISPHILVYLGWTIIASDGNHCLHLNVRSKCGSNPLRIVRAIIQPSEVRELWLAPNDKWVAPFLEGMRQVTMLVFSDLRTSSVADWLGEISRRKLFPKLEEVRVWTRSTYDSYLDEMSGALLGFLEHRHEMRRGISTLRVLKYPEPTINSYRRFQSWKAGFERFADHVIFEEPEERPRIELPDVCNLPWPLEKDVYPPLWPPNH